MSQTRILVVHHETAAAKIIAGILGDMYDVAMAGRADEALDELAARGADLVLLGWRLPGGGASRVLEWGYDTHVPVVVMTDDIKMAEDMRAAAAAHLLKPFSYKMLMQTVGTELRHKTAF